MKGDGQLKYSEVEVKKMLKAGELSLEVQIKFNILNFIRTIHLNRQNFIESSFGSEFFGVSTSKITSGAQYHHTVEHPIIGGLI